MARRRKRVSREPIELQVESLSHEGRGIATNDGKVVFIDNALPGEKVVFQRSNSRRKFDEGMAIEILTPSVDRVTPPCAYFEICGGCSLQHMSSDDQVAHKQAVLLELLTHSGDISPDEVLPPLRSPETGYRRKARLGVKFVPKKGGVLVGFREKASPYLADIQHCEVLDPRIGHRLTDLRELVGQLSVKDRLPQIEVAISDESIALVFRHLDPLTEDDHQVLIRFGEKNDIVIYLQPKGPDTVHQISPEQPADLFYQISDDEPTLHFLPSDFTQVNPFINRDMVARVMNLLRLEETDRVLDLFCGLGNFTLPLAKRVNYVLGVEGEAGLVKRANENAQVNGLDNVEFVCADLTQMDQLQRIEQSGFNKVLLDPARSGALDIIQGMSFAGVEKVIYVSCNPSTLARDVEVLVKEKGFRLSQAGVMDMFPHTSHVESIAVFERGKR